MTGRIWALSWDGQTPTVNTEILDTDLNIAAFGVDADGSLYLCAFDGRIYWFKASPVTAVREEQSWLATGYALRQNYPNPFNSGTSIRFALPHDEHVELSLYDLAGQKVGTLVDGRRGPGTYVVRWGGRDDSGRELSSGVYLYRLRAGGRVETRKLLLLR